MYRSLAVTEAKIFMIYVCCQSRKKIGQRAVKRSWPFYSRMFISILGYTKIILGLYLIHKKRNVKFKIYLELSYFCATQPTLTGHHGRHRPYIQMRSTLAGQQLPNLKSQEVTALYLTYKRMTLKKLEGRGLLSPPSDL